MTSGNLFDSSRNPHISINLQTMFRLGLFQMGLGIMSVLTLGVLNRIMIDPKLLAIPATVAAGTTAMTLFMSPARILFGQMSDSKKLWGYHRTGYIWTGLTGLAILVFLAVQVVWKLGASYQAGGWTIQTTGWIVLLGLVFALYGLCLDASSTPYAAMLVDVSDESNRSKLVGIVWSLLMVGIVVGAVMSKKLLTGLTPETLQASVNRLFTIMPIAVVCLGFLATIGVEKKYSRFASRSRSPQEKHISLGKAFRVLTASRQTGLFFSFLSVMTISLFLQQPILEPYGGEVFGMTVAQGALLNACWGIGVLLGMSIAGFLIVPRLGKQKTASFGCWAVAASFGLVIASGFTANQILLKSAILILGLSGGVLTNGAVTLMLDLTAAETAGTFLGAWGLAQAMAQALAGVGGGALLDIGRRLLHTPVIAYSLVFAASSLGMIVAVSLLNRVSVAEFQNSAQQAIADALKSA